MIIQPTDQPTRNRVIQEIDRTLSVFAGAGTGKTTLLTQRYLSLLQQKNISPRQIVAITFTIKAAAELRGRILDGLKENDLQHLTAAVETSPIGTIHAFCAMILRQFALEAGIDPQFSVISELEHRTFLNEVFQSWFTKSLSDHAKIFKSSRAIGISFNQIRKLAFKLYDYRDLLDKIAIVPEKMQPDVLQSITSNIRSLHQFAMEHCKDQEDDGFALIHQLNQAFQNIENEPKDTLGSVLLNEKIPKKMPGNQKNWDTADHCREFKTRFEIFRTQIELLQRSHAKTLFLDLVNWVKGYVELVRSEKQNRSILDFADLLLMTRDLIRNDQGVRTQLQEQFSYFLIDEFQDTDPMQAEIFWTLARDEKKQDSKKPWYDQPLIPGKLFTVGDFNQSIYRFRDASVETYRQCIETIQKQGELLYILQNFRSHPTIIETVNEFFSTILEENFKPLLTHELFGSEPAVHMLEIHGTEKKNESRTLEAGSIAAHIRHLIDSEKQIIDPVTKIQRGLQYKDIAMLFPAFTNLSIYERAFRENGIPFSIYKGGSFFDTPEIHSAAVMLAALLYPFDELIVASSLSSAWLGCSLDDLAQIKKQFGTFDYRKIMNVSDPRHRPIIILQILQKDILNLSPVEFVDAFLTQTQAFANAGFRVNASQVKENLRKFTWLAHEFETTHSSQIGKFYQWLFHLSDHSRETTEAIPSSDSNVVQMMTIHTSKGLEFPIVFLANFVSKIQEGSAVYANRFDQKLEIRMGDKETLFKTEGFDELAEREKRLFMDEKKRLIYVAMTRARDVIVVPSSVESNGYQQLLEPLMEQSPKFLTFDYSNAKTISAKPFQTETAVSHIIDTDFLSQIPKGYARTTATEQKEKPEVSSLAPKTYFQRPKLGIAFHEYVERSTTNKLQLDLLQQIVTENGIENQQDELAQLVTTYLGSDIYHRIQKANQVFKEVPFSYFRDGILYEGYIDLLIQEGKEFTIIDLKTDQISPAQLNERAQFYSTQLDIYAKALEQALQAQVKEKVLYFARLNQTVKVI